jgi:penicillin-binding protein 1C
VRAGRAAVFAVALGAGLVGAALTVTAPTPLPFESVRAAHRPSDVPLLARDDTVLHVLRTDARRRAFEWVPLAAISPALVRAVVAAEDRRFWSHGGVDLRALAAAAQRGGERGASTIAMQVAASIDADLSPHRGRRSATQKVAQMRLARALVRAWSREEILEAYLNLASFRGEVIGIGAAARLLAARAPHALADDDAIVLAALLRAPNAPADRVARRARHLAARLGGDAAGAEAAARRLRTEASAPRTALAPHLARRLLAGGNAAVRSTLDATLQRVAVGALRRSLLDLHDGHVRDGAVLVADNASGDVLAYVGGSGVLSAAAFVDTVRARRQAGSTLKPFLYGLALDRRLLTPASLLDDAPLELAVAGGIYRPRDYDQQFRGTVSLRAALAASLNVPAVRTLGLVGGDAFVDQLRRLGLQGVGESGEHYGPALALGAVEVSLWELVGAYRALANGGRWTPLRVTPADADAAPPDRDALAPAAGFVIGDVLADREARTTTFGLESALATPFWTAVKTGTSKDMRDNWCVGWSARYTVGAWVGNASGASMHDVSGVAGAAPVWLEVMRHLHRELPSPPPAPPAGVVSAPVRFTHALEPARREWFVAGTEPRTPEQAGAVSSPRIVTPSDGTIIALDPDIPDERERVVLEAHAPAGARWSMGETDLGTAATLALWEPKSGSHTITLNDGEGRALDTVVIEVRGSR